MATAGGSLRERPPQMGPLAALCLAPLHLQAASKRDFRTTEVFHTGTFGGSDQMESLFCLSNTHGCTHVHVCLHKNVTHANAHIHTYTQTHMHALFLPTLQYNARITMTVGGVILLSSVVFTLVICKWALCSENDTNPPCLNPQRRLVTAI